MNATSRALLLDFDVMHSTVQSIFHWTLKRDTGRCKASYFLCLKKLSLGVFAVKSDLAFEFGVFSLRHLDSYFWQVTGYRNN